MINHDKQMDKIIFDDNIRMENKKERKITNPAILLLCIAEYDHYETLYKVKADNERYRKLLYVISTYLMLVMLLLFVNF